MISYKVGDKIICKGKMDGRNIDGQKATIYHIYDQSPLRFCNVKFDKDFDSCGYYWDIFYEQISLDSKFHDGDIVEINGEIVAVNSEIRLNESNAILISRKKLI